MTALSTLIARLEAGESGREVDAEIARALGANVAISAVAGWRMSRAPWARYCEGGRWYSLPDFSTNMRDADEMIPKGWRLYDLHTSDDRKRWYCFLERIADRRLVHNDAGTRYGAAAMMIAALKARSAP